MPNNRACCRTLIEDTLYLGVIGSGWRTVAKAAGLHEKELSCIQVGWRKIQKEIIFMLNAYFSISGSKEKHSYVGYSL